jgi:hypothetical protein
MQAFEKQYIITPQEQKLNSWNDATQRLRQGMLLNSKLNL